MLVPLGDFFGQLVLAMGIAMVPRPGLVPGFRITACCIRRHDVQLLPAMSRKPGIGSDIRRM